MGLISIISGGLIKEATKPAASLIKKHGKEAYHSLMIEYSKCFESHISASYAKCSSVKNILYRDQSVDLNSQYVNVNFHNGSLENSDAEVVSKVLLGGKVLVSGTAGAGKTMFMKWSVLRITDTIENHQLIPLFLELRYINESMLKDGIPKLLHQSTSRLDGRVDFSLFQSGLEAGSFIVILDAVDEIKQDIRELSIQEIRKFITEYPDCPVLMSTRPDDSLESMQEIDVVRSMDMDQEQIVSVIQKLKYDSFVKERLIDKLRSGLFEEHEEFLSNPLLATIMLLTFDHAADIPTKITAFYKQAFETLYQRHDAAKGAYRRGHHAGLPLDEYEKVFSVFCFDSYIDSKVSFSDGDILSYFREALSFYEIDVSPIKLVRDAMESICVIQREGLDNVFVHRSFQEYFAALFMSRYDGEDFADQMENINRTGNELNILLMLMELAPEKLEEKWVLPKIKPIVQQIRNVRPNTKTGMTKIFSHLYNSIGVNVDTVRVSSYGVNHTGKNSGRAASWLNSIEGAYGGNMNLVRNIFSDEPIIEEFWEYIKNYYPENEDEMKSRLESRPKSEEFAPERSIRIDERDMQWLLHSGFPKRLGRVRDAIVKLHDDILHRMDNRERIMKRISVRRRRN